MFRRTIINVFAAIAITFGLFVAIPVFHGLFESSVVVPKGLSQKPQIPIQRLPPPRPPQPRVEEHIRTVQSHSLEKALAGASGGGESRFTPDLTVEGGAQDAGVAAMGGGELAAEVFEEGQTDEPQVALHRPAIEFPERARALEIVGKLVVEFVIETDGSVRSIDVKQSPHSSITAAARKTIATWRFKPARNKGIPVRLRVRQEIDFTLE